MRKMFIFASKPKEAAFWQKQASLLLRSVCTIFLTRKAKARNTPELPTKPLPYPVLHDFIL